MKQRTRLMHDGDDLNSFNMPIYKKRDGESEDDILLQKFRPQEHFIEAQVQEGDTLQAIALKFYCTVSELKRINQIHKDNEIFARRTIKVPVTPYSVLTESLPPQTHAVPSTSTQHHPSIHGSLFNNNNVAKRDEDFSLNCNEIVLNSTVAPAVIPFTDIEPTENVSEDTQLLPPTNREPMETVVVKELTSHGADFGLKWFHLVCLLLLLGVITPIIYVIFYVDKHEHHKEPHAIP